MSFPLISNPDLSDEGAEAIKRDDLVGAVLLKLAAVDLAETLQVVDPLKVWSMIHGSHVRPLLCLPSEQRPPFNSCARTRPDVSKLNLQFYSCWWVKMQARFADFFDAIDTDGDGKIGSVSFPVVLPF